MLSRGLRDKPIQYRSGIGEGTVILRVRLSTEHCQSFGSIFGTTFSIWATELDSCSPYSNSNSSTISNQPRFNELEMQSILFELDSTISCSIKKTSSTNSICSYRPQLFLSSSVCHVSSTVCLAFGSIFVSGQPSSK